MVRHLLVIVASLAVSTFAGLVLVASEFYRIVVQKLSTGAAHCYHPMGEVSFAYLQLAFVAGAGLALPLVLDQGSRLWQEFGRPSQRRPLPVTTLLAAGASYYIGLIFAYAAVLPVVASSLFAPGRVPECTRLAGYVNVAAIILFSVGCIFAAASVWLTWPRAHVTAPAG
jgi:Sec-independent protein secretion pathway component TatC